LIGLAFWSRVLKKDRMWQLKYFKNISKASKSLLKIDIFHNFLLRSHSKSTMLKRGRGICNKTQNCLRVYHLKNINHLISNSVICDLQTNQL
jgi:hypothetical protein